MYLAVALRDAGFYVPGIRPPSVPEGESLLRLTLCHNHTPELVDALLEELGQLPKMGFQAVRDPRGPATTFPRG
jgi:8-amino-7-oxononanoate synthase